MKLKKNDIKNRSLKNTKIKKFAIIFIAICLIWTIFFATDYIRVTKYYKKPLFSINVKSKHIVDSYADYIEQKYVGLGYSTYIRVSDVSKDKYDVDYAEIRLINKVIKSFFRGITG